jgi:hypothetical protein
MNKLSLVVALLAFVLISTTLSETNFEFPAEACATGLISGTYISCIDALANSV